MSTKSFHSFLHHQLLICYQSTGHLRQNKSTSGPKKPSFEFFLILLQSELVCTYDVLNIYAKKVSCHGHFKNDFKRLVVKKLHET